MNGNYPYCEEGAYWSEGFSLKQTLIKSPSVITKQKAKDFFQSKAI